MHQSTFSAQSRWDVVYVFVSFFISHLACLHFPCSVCGWDTWTLRDLPGTMQTLWTAIGNVHLLYITCSKSTWEQEYATPDLFTMGHWHGEISSNVTFAFCTKGCINVAVLHGRPLTHVRSLSIQNLNLFIALFFPFFFFFFHENSQRECIRVRKLVILKADTLNDGSVHCKKTDSLGA